MMGTDREQGESRLGHGEATVKDIGKKEPRAVDTQCLARKWQRGAKPRRWFRTCASLLASPLQQGTVMAHGILMNGS